MVLVSCIFAWVTAGSVLANSSRSQAVAFHVREVLRTRDSEHSAERDIATYFEVCLFIWDLWTHGTLGPMGHLESWALGPMRPQGKYGYI